MKRSYLFFLSLILTFGIVACSDSDSTNDTEEVSANAHTILGVVDDAYYLAQVESFAEGTFSFENNGTQLDADQAARIIASGDYLYSLNYGSGLLTQLQATEDGSFVTVKEINAGLSVGTNRPRYKLADANTIMVYNVVVEAITDTEGNVTDNKSTLRLATIKIPELTIENLTEFVIPQSANAQQGSAIGYDPMRVDSPVISGNKIYFGLMHMDMSDLSIAPPFRQPKQSGLETLVFDYPSLTNGQLTTSDQASGHTSGYRSTSMNVDESGDVYQINWHISGNNFDLSAGDKTVITRIQNGAYDSSYLFNISEALGLDSNVGANGWFYVANGIGYAPIYIEEEGHYSRENTWKIARIDVYNKTAVLLDVPFSNLFSYESAKVVDGKFYMAISPIGGESYIYEFDPNSTSETGFTRGLKLDGGNVTVEGIY